ncbi:hypothetical protein [Streptomyces sp. NBC_01006]|uniref:hypothetical protein n=1 Tax=Streptomyces sp. NBC_01006 TaxID=2903716 RepID=UPI0038657737|nr:hypothetical protein OG509_06440 [Streptomyces sp. NBC_01006]
MLTVLSVLIVSVARTPSAPARESRLRKVMFDARTALGPVRRPHVFAEAGAAALATRALDLPAAVTTAEALDLRLSVAVLVLVLLSIEVSGILPTLPGQLGTFEAAVLGTSGRPWAGRGFGLRAGSPCSTSAPPDPAGGYRHG